MQKEEKKKTANSRLLSAFERKHVIHTQFN